jgi:hypothetical protein
MNHLELWIQHFKNTNEYKADHKTFAKRTDEKSYSSQNLSARKHGSKNISMYSLGVSGTATCDNNACNMYNNDRRSCSASGTGRRSSKKPRQAWFGPRVEEQGAGVGAADAEGTVASDLQRGAVIDWRRGFDDDR